MCCVHLSWVIESQDSGSRKLVASNFSTNIYVWFQFMPVDSIFILGVPIKPWKHALMVVTGMERERLKRWKGKRGKVAFKVEKKSAFHIHWLSNIHWTPYYQPIIPWKTALAFSQCCWRCHFMVDDSNQATPLPDLCIYLYITIIYTYM